MSASTALEVDTSEEAAAGRGKDVLRRLRRSPTAIVGAVLAAVHHAEVVAHRTGEPFGSLVLAVAVTVIEVGLIVMLMVSTDGDTSTLAEPALVDSLVEDRRNR